jgi:peptidoglycan hydrolase-like protein with peptidoglycan-binding domain
VRSSSAVSSRTVDGASGREPVARRDGLRILGFRLGDAIGLGLGGCVALVILINALFLQAGPHPAPIFSEAPNPASPAPAVTPRPATGVTTSALPRPRPADIPAARADLPATPRASTAIIADIQRELARRGYYDGLVDGLHGPKTDAAIREFEAVAGLKSGAEPNEDLLRAILRSMQKAKPAASAPGARSAAPARPDPIAELISPSKRVLAVQRALTDFGYGQIKPTGILDAPTQAAIAKFERARKLPVTGQISDRLARELAVVTGRPLD